MIAIKCISCGKFIPYSQLGATGRARFYFEPDNHFGPGLAEWTCTECVKKECEEPA